MRRINSGFTLVELIVVIVILGILSAIAIPRYIDLRSNANIAAMQGLAGSLRSGIAVVKAGFYANNKTTPVTMDDGTTVAVMTGAGVTKGLPTGTAAGIGNVVDLSGYGVAYAAGVATFTLTGGPATCNITYTASTGVLDTSPLTTANCS